VALQSIGHSESARLSLGRLIDLSDRNLMLLSDAGLLMHMMDEADATRLRSFLAQERIGWVYLERGDGFTATVEAAGLEPVFENSAGRLYHLPTTR
jgi:hypothetical protein